MQSSVLPRVTCCFLVDSLLIPFDKIYSGYPSQLHIYMYYYLRPISQHTPGKITLLLVGRMGIDAEVHACRCSRCFRNPTNRQNGDMPPDILWAYDECRDRRVGISSSTSPGLRRALSRAGIHEQVTSCDPSRSPCAFLAIVRSLPAPRQANLMKLPAC